MRGDTFISFRGEADVRICYDLDFSGPGSGVGVEWWFADKTDVDVTADEEEQIIKACVASGDDRASDPDECGGPPLSFIADRDTSKPLGTPISELSGRPGTKGYEEFKRIARSWGYD